MASLQRSYKVNIVVVNDVSVNNDVAIVSIDDLNQPSSRPEVVSMKANYQLGTPAPLPEFAAAQVKELVTRTLIAGGVTVDQLGVRDPGGN